ncbi:MAG: tyrosine-type recombinase/integrase [Planctomycetaceae bacterium]|nr:tyrosine-type recombinase/integrase [Planctomycetaceae bacterium]MBT6153877.1 tyrosine-type recombinase/integrase [Planctomycetaceae bacterium]
MSRRRPQPWFRPSRNTWYVAVNGKLVNLNTADRDEAFGRWHELMVQSPEPPDSPTVAVLIILAAFAEWAEKHTKPMTYDWYRRFLESFGRSISSDLRVADLKPFHVTRWLDGNPQWGDSGRRGAITSLKRAFQWALDEGYIDRSPVASIKKPPTPRRETVLTKEQEKIVLAEASDEVFRNLLTAIQETGVRPQEIWRVEARHVDLENKLWVFPIGENKTGRKTQKPRIVFLTPTALEITRKLMKKHLNGPLFRNSRGEPWTPNAVRCRFRRLRNRLSDKLPSNLCTYVFRHTYATNALERGVDPITLAELMGHRDATMVSRVYQHLDKRVEHMKNAALRATGQNVSSPSP